MSNIGKITDNEHVEFMTFQTSLGYHYARESTVKALRNAYLCLKCLALTWLDSTS